MVPHAVIPALRRPRQKDEEFKVGYMVNEFQANLEYIVSLKMNIRREKRRKGGRQRRREGRSQGWVT